MWSLPSRKSRPATSIIHRPRRPKFTPRLERLERRDVPSTLTWINPAYLRFGVGVLLVLYTIYGLARPAFKPMKIGVAADIGIGLANGLVGGLTIVILAVLIDRITQAYGQRLQRHKSGR